MLPGDPRRQRDSCSDWRSYDPRSAAWTHAGGGRPEVIGCIMLVYFLANIVMYLMETGLMNIFVQMIRIPKSLLFPAILVCCVLGVYAINNRIFEVLVMVVSGNRCLFSVELFQTGSDCNSAGIPVGATSGNLLADSHDRRPGKLVGFHTAPHCAGSHCCGCYCLSGTGLLPKVP